MHLKAAILDPFADGVFCSECAGKFWQIPSAIDEWLMTGQTRSIGTCMRQPTCLHSRLLIRKEANPARYKIIPARDPKQCV